MTARGLPAGRSADKTLALLGQRQWGDAIDRFFDNAPGVWRAARTPPHRRHQYYSLIPSSLDALFAVLSTVR